MSIDMTPAGVGPKLPLRPKTAMTGAEFAAAVRSGTTRDWGGYDITGPVDLRAAHITYPLIVDGARFTDTVDLAQARFDQAVDLTNCIFEKNLVLAEARVEGSLRLDGTSLGAVRATTPVPPKSIQKIVEALRQGIERTKDPAQKDRRTRALRIREQQQQDAKAAAIEETVADCDCVIVHGAFSLMRVRVFGAVSANFAKIDTELRLDGATIHGNVTLRQVTVREIATDATVRRSAAAQMPFRVDGSLNLTGAEIDGDVRLFGAVIDGDVSAQAAKIGGNVLFRGVPGIRCHVRGGVWLVVARVTGALDVSGIRVHGGFVIVSMTIGASFRCVETRLDGAMLAENAHITGSVDISASRLSGVSFVGADIGSRVMLSSMDAGGDFSFDGATIGGDLYCNSYRDPKRGMVIRGAFTANGATIRGGLVFESVTVKDGLQLQTATIAQSFILRTGSLNQMARSTAGPLWLLGLNVGGAMDLSGTRITGDVLLPSAVIAQNLLCTTIREDATEISGNLHLGAARIGGAVNVAGAQIAGSIQASSATVDGELTVMYGVTGRDAPSLRRTTIGRDLEVVASTIGKEVCLAGASVTGHVTFAGSQLNGRLTCDGSSVAEATVDTFAPKLDPRRRADLIEQARTTVTSIGGDLRLQRAKISGGIALAGARVGGTLDLRDASVRSNVETAGPGGFRTKVERFDCETLEIVGDMDLTSLDAAADVVLRDASITGSVSFSGSRAGAEIGGALRCNGASISDLVVSGQNFVATQGESSEARVVLERARLGRLEIIPPLQVTLDLRNLRADRAANLENGTVLEILDKTAPFEKGNYLAFENAFRNAGRDDDADKVHVAMRRRDRAYTKSTLRRLFDWFLDFTIGYGTTSQRVVMTMLILFLFSLLVFQNPKRLRLDIPPSAERPYVSDISPRRWDINEAAFFAAQLHVPIISLGVKTDVQPRGTRWRIYAMATVALHWVMWPLLIASLSGLVRKKA